MLFFQLFLLLFFGQFGFLQLSLFRRIFIALLS